MNEQDHYQRTLMQDADRGNPIARNLLIHGWLGAGNTSAVNSWLKDHKGGAQHLDTVLFEAELSCFHGWVGEAHWSESLRHCAGKGHKQARFIVSLYEKWAKLQGLGATTDALTATWSSPPWREVAAQDGLAVYQCLDFAPHALLAFIRNSLGRALRPSAVVDPDTGAAVRHPVRINSAAQWFPEQLGWAGKLLEQRMGLTANYDPRCGEVFSLLHYTPGERYKAHYDCLPSEQAHSPQGMAQGGQRTLTVLLTLGDQGFEGGATAFPRLGIDVHTPPGALLRFNNTDDNGQPLRSSLHEGQPVTRGEKWLLSKWVREQHTPYGAELNPIG